MIPVLFKGNETNFNHNGIGLLKDTLSCEVSEVRNGSFDLELVYPITGSYFKDLKNGNIIQAKPNDTDQPHNFRITEIDKTLSDKEVVVYGVSTTNDLGGNMVKSLYLEDVTPQVILNEMKKVLHYPTTFNFVSNITTVGTVNWELNNPLNLIVGEEGSLVDIFGGEVKRTNDTLFLYGRRGKDNVTTIRAGKNLDGFKMTEAFQGKYTQILPYFKYDEEIPGEVSGDTEGETVRQEVTVFGSIVSSPYHGRYPVNAIKPVDFSQNETVRDAKTLEALNAEATLYFSDLYSEIDKPSVNINVDMIQLVDSEQYELYEKLEKIELTDTVSVYIPEYDVDVLVKITELKYDSLRERTISIVAGSSGRTSLMDEISGSYKQFTKTLVDDKIQSATSGIINQILTKKDGGNVYAGRATPPDNAELGDIWFKDTGGGDVELYEFDGVNWVRKMYKGFGDDVRQLVDDKIAEANVAITEALEEHDNTIAQAMTNAGQANDLAQQAKTEAANASLSASAANQDAQQAIADAANAKADALAAITDAGQANDLAQEAITKANSARTELLGSIDTTRTELLGRVNTLDSKAEELNTKATNLQTQADSIASQLDTMSAEEMIYRSDIEDTLSQYSSTIQDIDGKVASNTSQITQQATQIASKVSQTDFNAEKTKISNLQTSVTQQAGQIALKAEKTYVDTVKKTVDSNTTSITQQAGQIALKANQTDLNNLTGRMSTAESNITQVPNQIALAVEKVTAKIPTSAGNKNYLSVSKVINRGSNNFSYNESTGIWSMTVPANTDGFGKGVNFYTSGNTVMLNGGETLFIGLTVMVDKTAPITFDINNRLHVNPVSGNDNDDRAKAIVFPTNRIIEPNVWTRVYLMYTAKPGVPIWDDNTNFGLKNTSENVQLQIKEVIMAKSNIPVDYQKAESDIDRSISSLKTSVTQQADQIALKANQTELNNLTGRMSTAEGKITTQAGEIALKASKTELTPITNALNTKVDINQVNSAITTGTSGIRQEVSAVKGVLDGGISARNYAVGTTTPSTHSVDSRTTTVSNGYVVKILYSTYKNKTLRDLGFKVGDKYTVIFDIYAENNTSFKEYRVEGYQAGYLHLVAPITNTIGTPDAPTQFVGTYTITSDESLNAYRWAIRFDLSYFNVTVKNFRIFKGEIKQDWYPAWEDQEAALEATKARVDITEQSITGLVSGVKTLPDGRTSVFATKIESLEGAITQRVTTQELNNRGYQTSTDVTNTINNRTDLAKKTDIPTTSGGRNLAQKTSSEWSTAWTTFSGVTNTSFNLYKVLVDDLAVGDKLKTRIVLKHTNITSATGQTAKIWLQGYGNITNWGSGSYNDSPARTISGSGEMIFEHEFTITADHLKNTYLWMRFRTDYIASGALEWKLAKVEKGPLWTAWTPAPEDIEADITDKLTGYVTNQTYTTYTTTRQQTDGQITEQINQTVSKVPTGPVNLVINGFDPQTISPWKQWSSEWTLELTNHGFFYNGTKKLMRFKTSTATTKGTFESNVFNLKRNTKYTIRVGIFANSNCKDLRFCFCRGSSTSISDYAMAPAWFIGNTTKLEYKTITVDSGNYDYGKLTFDHNGTKTVGQSADMYIAEISIIEGEYNNSWTPSFDELITEQKFNETKSTVDAFSRAIGTRDENGFVPNIARLVMTQDAVISEVAKYGEHNNNLIQDAEKFSTTSAVNGTSISNYMPSRISWLKSGSTSDTWAGINIPVNVNRFIAGEKYTVSFDYYFYTAPDAEVCFTIKDHTNNKDYIYYSLGDSTTPTGVWRHFEETFSISTGTATNTYSQGVYLFGRRDSNVAIKDIMLVRGEKIGPFSTSQVDVVATRVEQTANSYSVKFLNNANDITTQLNLTSSGARIKSSLIHLDGNVTVSGTAWMSGAIIKDLSADKITTGTLNANNVNITNLSVNDVSGITATYLQSVIGTAFIDWMRGKTITAMNGNMAIDLNNAKITFNSDARIYFNSDDNALVRKKGDVTAFVNFADDLVSGGVYLGVGVTSHNVGVTTASNSDGGKFAGMRVYRPNDNVDLLRLIGDTITLAHGTEGRYFNFKPTELRNNVDMVRLAGAVYTLSRIFMHLSTNGWSFTHPSFIQGVKDEMARGWLHDFAIGGLPR